MTSVQLFALFVLPGIIAILGVAAAVLFTIFNR